MLKPTSAQKLDLRGSGLLSTYRFTGGGGLIPSGSTGDSRDSLYVSFEMAGGIVSSFFGGKLIAATSKRVDIVRFTA
jgi:hypothetical protein